jgi:hypothetical protein
MADTQQKKRRRALTDADRMTIRQRHREQPSHDQGALAQWYSSETGHTIDQSMVSRALSAKYDYLDNVKNRRAAAGKKKRETEGDWPSLEAALFEWQQQIQAKKGVITGDVLKEKASQIWKLLPQYKDLPEPKWSNGWCDNFKKRFHIKNYVRHSEANSADISSPDNIAQMERLRQLCASYALRDIYNMDETGLF